jgi:hypothetical protein
MKKLLYRLPSSRSFAKLLSLLAVAFAAFAAAELFFVQQALAGTGKVCCKGTNCPSGIVASINRYCEGSAACNTGYQFEKTATGATKVCYSAVTPPQDSVIFTMSGPPVVCQFFRPELPEDVGVIVESPALGDIGAGTGPFVYRMRGMATCALANEGDEHHAFFDVDLTIGCGTRSASGNAITHSLLFSDLNGANNCQDGTEPISGSLTGLVVPPPFGEITPPVGNTPGSPLWRMLTYCGGTPEVTPASDFTKCVLKYAIPSDLNASPFEKKVCPKDPPTRPTNGQIFGMRETIVSGGEFHGGKYAVCACQGDLGGGEVTSSSCVQGNTIERITYQGEAASQCEFDWQNAVAGDAIDLNGKNPVNAFIYDGPGCNTGDIVKTSLRVCGGNVTPTQIKPGTSAGKSGLTMKISEPACVADMSNLLVGQTRDIDITGTFNDLTRFVGTDDVEVVCNGSRCPPGL